MWYIKPNGWMEPVLRMTGMPDCQSLPRQCLPMVYWQNGYVDVIRPRAVMEKNSMWGDCAIPFVVDEHLFEVDYPEDIPLVEDALRCLERGNEPTHKVLPRHPV